jgi:hypothetical protein
LPFQARAEKLPASDAKMGEIGQIIDHLGALLASYLRFQKTCPSVTMPIFVSVPGNVSGSLCDGGAVKGIDGS